MDLTIKNVKLFWNENIVKACISINNGRIFKISKNKPFNASETHDAEGRLLLPGLIDVHVHLRDMQAAYKEDFLSGTSAALAGGVTTLLDMPNNKPPVVSINTLLEKMQKASEKIVADVGFFFGIPKNTKEIFKASKAGVCGFKTYPHSPLSPHEENILNDEEKLTLLLKEIKKSDKILAFHPDLQQNSFLNHDTKPPDDPIDFFLKKHGENNELEAIKWLSSIAQNTNTKIHVVHMSTQKSVQEIKTLKKRGQKITCEVTPHHLLLTDEELRRWKGIAKMLPPLRKSSDIEALWKGLIDGTIDAIATDHAPHSLEEKSRKFEEAANGICGLETMLPLVMTEVLKGKISLSRFLELVCKRPAEIYRIKRKGEIIEGNQADLVLVQTGKEEKINPEKFQSKAKHSPFAGRTVKAKVYATYLGGELAYKEGEIMMKPGSGKILKL